MKLRKRTIPTTPFTPIIVTSEQSVKPTEIITVGNNTPKEVLNTNNTSFANFYEKAVRISDNCKDYFVLLNNDDDYYEYMRFVLKFNEDVLKVHTKDTDDVFRTTGISHYALSQLATKLGIPMRYIDNCIHKEMYGLVEDNFHSWLKYYNGKLFIRQYKDSIRGILTDRYSCLDTEDILCVLDDYLDMDKYTIKGSFLNEERLHLRFVSNEKLPVPNEDLFAGIFIDSSDVGRSVLSVNFGIYKQVCTNGLIVAKNKGVLFQQKHIGITPDEFKKGFIAAISKVDVLAENAVELVKECKGKKILLSSQQEIDDFIKRIKDTTSISQTAAMKVIDLMQNRYGSTKWGMINGLTEVAQDYTLERRIELEKIAGNILIA